MTAIASPPPPEAAPAANRPTAAETPSPHRFGSGDYLAMIEAGVIAEDAKVELIDGLVVTKIGKGDFHNAVMCVLAQLLVPRVPSGWTVRIKMPVRLDGSVPEPDVCIVSGTVRDHLRQPPAPDAVVAAIEVADSSLTYDRTTKAAVYAAAGIADYLIVDLPGRRLLRHSQPSETGYGRVDTVERFDLMLGPTTVVLEAAALFDQALGPASTDD